MQNVISSELELDNICFKIGILFGNLNGQTQIIGYRGSQDLFHISPGCYYFSYENLFVHRKLFK